MTDAVCSECGGLYVCRCPSNPKGQHGGEWSVAREWFFELRDAGQTLLHLFETVDGKIVFDVDSKIAVSLTKEEAVMLGNMLIHLGANTERQTK